MSQDTDVAAKEVLAGLRAALDPDQERAGRKFTLLRRKLVSFFEWSGASSPDACADEALTAAAWKLTDGAPIQNVPAACVAIARTILSKHEQAPAQSATPDAATPPATPDPRADLEPLLHAFEAGLDELSADSRDLMLTYYAGEQPHAIEARRVLAERLRLPQYQLRFHAHRTRSQLEQSVMGTAPAGQSK